jgi:hypothetical protein
MPTEGCTRRTSERNWTVPFVALPAIREFRTPILTGLVWIVSLWVVARHRGVATSMPFQDLRVAWTDVGTSGRIAALIVFAYTVGSLLEWIGTFPLIYFTGDDAWRHHNRVFFVSRRGFWALVEAASERIAELKEAIASAVSSDSDQTKIYERAIDALKPGHIPQRYWAFAKTVSDEIDREAVGIATQLCRELDLAAMSLRESGYSVLFDELDRLRGEYLLRLGLCPPFVLLIVCLGAWVTPFWFLGLVLITLAYLSGVRRRVDAGDFLARAIRLRYCDSPALRRLGELGNVYLNDACPGEPRVYIAEWASTPPLGWRSAESFTPPESLGLVERVVPGLRDLRAPLVGGYVLLFGLWVAAGARESHTPGPLHVMKDVIDVFGKPGLAVALSVVAFFVGAGSEIVSETLSEAFVRVYNDASQSAALSVSVRGHNSLIRVVDRAKRDFAARVGETDLSAADSLFDNLVLRARTPADPSAVALDATGRLKRELDLTLMTAMALHPRLWEAVARLQADAALRFALVLPVTVALAVFVVDVSAWYLFLIAIPLIFAFAGAARHAAGGDRLAAEMLAGRVTPGLFASAETFLATQRMSDRVALKSAAAAPAQTSQG